MTDVRPQDLGETPTIEVTVFRDGEVLLRELCETEEQVALVVDQWADVNGVECEVKDLSEDDRGIEPVEHEPPESPWEDYPRVTGMERQL